MYEEMGEGRKDENIHMFGEREHTEREQTYTNRERENTQNTHLRDTKADTMIDYFNIALWYAIEKL